ncbi:hypothetical protein K0B96_15045 [Horticoccus luteus]|uniref:Uncharacterized protein n=1 Tax=Horticoccus luteus TaxID=2862869 RepID=A0A8F9TSV1_9BACT|nr:hypothetical protein [Horticoccus luteus]QYM78599.1 hypothetical protein K0B96_15045 [Horticoccus luteus]
MSAEQVILVVDRMYGSKIVDLPASAALWIVDSPANQPFISEVKKKFTPAVRGDLSWFKDSPQLSPASLAAQKIDTIEDHHGEYSQHPAYSRLTIIGTSPDGELCALLEKDGFKLTLSNDREIEFER